MIIHKLTVDIPLNYQIACEKEISSLGKDNEKFSRYWENVTCKVCLKLKDNKNESKTK